MSHGYSDLRFFGLNIIQYEDYPVTIDVDDKLQGISSLQLRRSQRSDFYSPCTTLKSKAFASINRSVGCLGITASPFGFLLSSLFQQAAPCPTASDFCKQASLLPHLKKLDSCTTYKSFIDHSSQLHLLSVLVFWM